MYQYNNFLKASSKISNLSVKSDSLISLLNPNTNLEFENLNKYNVKFPIFESDFLLNDINDNWINWIVISKSYRLNLFR